jgi:hypothetical protein
MKPLVAPIMAAAASVVVIGFSAPAASAGENVSQFCRASDDFGGSHGQCVRFKTTGNVQLCRIIAGDIPGQDPYPYTLTLFLRGGGVFGPVTVNNLGGCVSSFQRNKDWNVAMIVSGSPAFALFR